jgi:hypothetical protein
MKLSKRSSALRATGVDVEAGPIGSAPTFDDEGDCAAGTALVDGKTEPAAALPPAHRGHHVRSQRFVISGMVSPAIEGRG